MCCVNLRLKNGFGGGFIWELSPLAGTTLKQLGRLWDLQQEDKNQPPMQHTQERQLPRTPINPAGLRLIAPTPEAVLCDSTLLPSSRMLDSVIKEIAPPLRAELLAMMVLPAMTASVRASRAMTPPEPPGDELLMAWVPLKVMSDSSMAHTTPPWNSPTLPEKRLPSKAFMWHRFCSEQHKVEQEKLVIFLWVLCI